jgi:hypothetical protein
MTLPSNMMPIHRPTWWRILRHFKSELVAARDQAEQHNLTTQWIDVHSPRRRPALRSLWRTATRDSFVHPFVGTDRGEVHSSFQGARPTSTALMVFPRPTVGFGN